MCLFWPLLLRDIQDIHQLARLSPLRNSNWEPQCPVAPSASEAKTCTPYGGLLCTNLLKLSTLSYRLFWNLTGGYPTHQLARLSPLRNASWEPQCPVYPSESEANTCTPYGVLLCKYLQDTEAPNLHLVEETT